MTITKLIELQIDQSTWPRNRPPSGPFALNKSDHNIDIQSALLMLGTLTMPNLMSPASPARFWAWLRYFLAVGPENDLRITMDFADLDPHQKSILSDDFGVALSTQWLFDALGGFAEIVDGRRFLLQFGHLLRKKTKVSKAKVGPNKAPDFVVRDLSGLWHVLECKGTQSGRSCRNQFLKNAIAQRHAINIIGSIRGEKLAAGVSIANTQDQQTTQIKIIDPESDDPLITLQDENAEDMGVKARRISVARGLAMIGLSDAAEEMTMPEDTSISEQYLSPAEFRRSRMSREERTGRTREQFRSREFESIQHGA